MSAILFSNPFITPPPPPVPVSGAATQLGVSPARAISGSGAEGDHSGQSGNGRQGPNPVSRPGARVTTEVPRPAGAAAASVVLAMAQMLARRAEYGDSTPQAASPYLEMV